MMRSCSADCAVLGSRYRGSRQTALKIPNSMGCTSSREVAAADAPQAFRGKYHGRQ